MKEDEAIIEQYKVDTKKVQQKISDLRSGAITFQVHTYFKIFVRVSLFFIFQQFYSIVKSDCAMSFPDKEDIKSAIFIK